MIRIGGKGRQGMHKVRIDTERGRGSGMREMGKPRARYAEQCLSRSESRSIRDGCNEERRRREGGVHRCRLRRCWKNGLKPSRCSSSAGSKGANDWRGRRTKVARRSSSDGASAAALLERSHPSRSARDRYRSGTRLDEEVLASERALPPLG